MAKRTSPIAYPRLTLTREEAKGQLLFDHLGWLVVVECLSYRKCHCYKYPFPVTVPAVGLHSRPIGYIPCSFGRFGAIERPSMAVAKSWPRHRHYLGSKRKIQASGIQSFDDVIYHMIRSHAAHDWSIDSVMTMCSGLVR
jgi:hypothetical protein